MICQRTPRRSSARASDTWSACRHINRPRAQETRERTHRNVEDDYLLAAVPYGEETSVTSGGPHADVRDLGARRSTAAGGGAAEREALGKYVRIRQR